ncbi:MAG: hypothetical protein OXS47_01245 [Chloroflexota bacterium]|nr:hypothetical protein [Chloroflexota bacterium]
MNLLGKLRGQRSTKPAGRSRPYQSARAAGGIPPLSRDALRDNSVWLGNWVLSRLAFRLGVAFVIATFIVFILAAAGPLNYYDFLIFLVVGGVLAMLFTAAFHDR